MAIKTLTRAFRARAAILLVAFALVPAAPAQAAMQEEGRAIIDSILKGFLTVYTRKGSTRADRERSFDGLFSKHFDFKRVGKWVMGRPWRQATAAQREDFLRQFRTYMVKTYVAQIGVYEKGEKVKVVGVEPDRKGVIVTSRFIRPRGKRSIEVKWRMRRRGDALKIVDVVIENISMSLNQRREFAAVYQKRGGTVDGLIGAIKEKIAELNNKK